MSVPQRRRGRYGSLALGVSAVAAVTGAVYWYFSHYEPSIVERIWRSSTRSVQRKKKSVVVVLNDVCLSMSQIDICV